MQPGARRRDSGCDTLGYIIIICSTVFDFYAHLSLVIFVYISTTVILVLVRGDKDVASFQLFGWTNLCSNVILFQRRLWHRMPSVLMMFVEKNSLANKLFAIFNRSINLHTNYTK